MFVPAVETGVTFDDLVSSVFDVSTEIRLQKYGQSAALTPAPTSFTAAPSSLYSISLPQPQPCLVIMSDRGFSALNALHSFESSLYFNIKTCVGDCFNSRYSQQQVCQPFPHQNIRQSPLDAAAAAAAALTH
jgi:hypothetical protein